MLAISTNPFAEFRKQCESLLYTVVKKNHFDVSIPRISLDLPPNPQFGELTSSLCFEMAKQLGISPIEIARQIEKAFQVEKNNYPLIESVEAAGQGYVNFHVNFAKFSALTISSAKALDTEYGYVKTENPEKVIVEHTSVNPVHPIHVGAARNSILGDSLARIQRARGHTVSRHYYIDDVGRQSALIAYGYNLLGKPKPEGKPDHFIGSIYTLTNCLVEIHRLKDATRQVGLESEGEYSKITKDLDDWISIAADLREKSPGFFDTMLEEIKVENPESQINRLMQEYESGNEETKQLIRQVSQLCLEGFKETFARLGITFDSWDWESSFIWNGDVTRYLSALGRTPYVLEENGVLEFDGEKVAKNFGLKGSFGVKENQEIPSLTLGRSDGTTLYTTRDISYSIWKFNRADRVINVIGMEQKLPQLQLRLALCALGYTEKAKKLVHFAYNLVNLLGYRMSGRRGRYITLDEVINESVARAYEEVSKRSTELAEEEKRKIAETVGVGAVKYALIGTDPLKPVVFTWDKVLNFETNSGPYIQYSYARAGSILRKASKEVLDADFSLLKETLEHDLILMISRFPEVFADAADNLKPDALADFANALADRFNTFYAASPVIRAETTELGDARLLLVDVVRIVLCNVLSLIGIEAPQRM